MADATSEDNRDALLNNVLHRVLVPYEKHQDGTTTMCRLFSPYKLPQNAVNLEDWTLVDNVPLPGQTNTSAPVGHTVRYRDQLVRTDIVMVEPGTAAILQIAVFQWDVEAPSARIRGLRMQPRTQNEIKFLQSLPKVQ